MSLILTVNVREGIVIAADSRLTLNSTNQQAQNQIINFAVGMSDTNRKIFVTPQNVGIAPFGAADIQGVPIAGYIDSFIISMDPELDVKQVADELIKHFRGYAPIPQTLFHVAGYNKNENPEQEVYQVDVKNNNVTKLNKPNEQGMAYGGEGDVITRLLQPVFQKDNKNNYQPLPQHPIPINFFTIQDAIDFSVYIIKTTIDTIRFQSRPKTVGGPIDVLVIRPNSCEWVSKKWVCSNKCVNGLDDFN
jgi:hypothetical protein